MLERQRCLRFRFVWNNTDLLRPFRPRTWQWLRVNAKPGTACNHAVQIKDNDVCFSLRRAARKPTLGELITECTRTVLGFKGWQRSPKN